MPFEPSDANQSRFVSFAPAEFPDSRDAEVDEYIEALIGGGPDAFASASRSVSAKGVRVLCAYAERAATRAVRERDRGLLLRATVALVLGGLERNSRDALLRMPLVEDASVRLGYALPDVFEDAAAVVGHPGSVSLVMWLSRAAEDRTLECMGFAAVGTGPTFRYNWTG